MPTGLYSPTSTRSTPSPPPEFEAGSSLARGVVSQASTTSAHLRSRKVRNGPGHGLTPIRPTLDYSTTGSYLGGESAVDNDTTTDGEAFASQTFGQPKRVSSMASTSSRAPTNSSTMDTQEGRTHRITVPRQGRESPHPPGSGSRGAGSVSSSPQYTCLLPDKIHLASAATLDARQTGEYALLALAVLLAAWKLLLVSETIEALALSALVASSFIYEYWWSIASYLFPPGVEPAATPSPNSLERPIRRPKVVTTPQRGYIFMTDEKNYRECTDNGESTALLLGPLIVASALYAAKKIPASHVLASNWHMEGPLPFQQHVHGPQSVVASRRALLQCISLNTMLLFAHMYAANSRRGWPRPENTPHQGRRILLFVGFSGFWTAVSYAAYEITRALQWDILNEITRLDVICSTFFFQACLYVMIRLARRAFTMGEIVLVAHGATALFLEAVNISIIKQWPSIAGYVKTFREPSPLLVFQLALLPGSILIGFLLSPLLALSRHIARRPRLRLRAPHQTEQLIYRRMLAIGLAAGAVLLVGGLLGGWVRWLLGGRDPWLWVIRSLANGRRPWSRPALVSWWALLGSLSVAGWNRQLARSRRHPLLNPYTTATTRTPTQTQFKQKPSVPPPMSEVSAVGTYPPLVPRLGTLQAQALSNTTRVPPASLAPTRDIQAVATDLLDAADKHVPTLSRNGRRKYFHALAVLMFVPGISWDPAFTHLSFSLAFALFTFAEYIRYFAIYPFGAAVHVFLSEFLDEKDSGTAILSHFYLLTGCALPLWLESPWRVLGLVGVIVLGVGDALASIIGKRIGTHRWFPSSGKTVEGTVAFAVSVFACNWAIAAREFSTVHIYHMGCAVAMAALLEALSKQNDNLTIPLYMWCTMVLLPAGTP